MKVKLEIEIEVSENGRLCGHCDHWDRLWCDLHQSPLDHGDRFPVRCQRCLDAEVKEKS